MTKLGLSITLIVCSLAFVTSSNAQDSMPLPAIFFNAKTIAIVNEAGEADYGDRAYDELKKWAKYSIIADAKEADLVLVITASEHYVGTFGSTSSRSTGEINGTAISATTNSTLSTNQVTSGRTYIHIFDGKSGEKVFSDGKGWGTFKSATRELIRKLRKRVDSQSKK